MPDTSEVVDWIVLAISREEVEAAARRSVDDLMTLSDSTQLRRQLAHGVMFCITGWDKDPREVSEIPECRAYLQALYAQRGYWLHFLVPVPNLRAVSLLCLVEGAAAADNNGRRVKRVNPEEVQALITAMLRPLAALHGDVGLTAEKHQLVLGESVAAIAECWA
jgi:hypothetical protein